MYNAQVVSVARSQNAIWGARWARVAAANLAGQSAIPLASRAMLRIPAVTEKVPAPDSRAVLGAIRTSAKNRSRNICGTFYGSHGLAFYGRLKLRPEPG